MGIPLRELRFARQGAWAYVSDSTFALGDAHRLHFSEIAEGSPRSEWQIRCWRGQHLGSWRWQASSFAALWMHGRYERASTPESIGVGLAGRPTGQRNGWVVGGGVVLRKGR